MEYLQYMLEKDLKLTEQESFKPCYKWNTFNTLICMGFAVGDNGVLNLVINGIPSIP